MRYPHCGRYRSAWHGVVGGAGCLDVPRPCATATGTATATAVITPIRTQDKVPIECAPAAVRPAAVAPPPPFSVSVVALVSSESVACCGGGGAALSPDRTVVICPAFNITH